MMKVTYLAHSGFLVELSSCALLFDYWKGQLPRIENKPLYVFVSHAHHDHYNKEVIRELLEQGAHVIASMEVDLAPSNHVHKMIGNAHDIVEGLSIHTLTSTDEGVAFLVKVEDKYIYHAGDLHWWHWEEESTPEENEEMKHAYLHEISKLRSYSIDIAFLPVDPRLGTMTYAGLEAFLREVGARVVFPMHFWEDYHCIKDLETLPALREYPAQIMELHKESEEFEL